jgi:hypothetical protein
MKESLVGTQAFGLRMPLIKVGNADTFMDTIINQYKKFGARDGDIIGITESVVARNAGMYVNLEEVGAWIKRFKPTATHLVLLDPIFSRNRFVPILRGLLCADNIKKVTILSREVDEVGNFVQHQITGVNYKEVYRELIEGAGKEFRWLDDNLWTRVDNAWSGKNKLVLDCRLHVKESSLELTLQDIFGEINNWGLLGMNAAGNDKLKLFPDKSYSQWFVNTLQAKIEDKLNVHAEVMVYGDGAFKDPVTGIWEWADPVVSPAWTSGLDGMPAELKLKNAIDNGLSEDDIKKSIKDNRGKASQELGTTPRRIVDLLGSLMDLMSGSGDKGTPVIIVRDYFKKYID